MSTQAPNRTLIPVSGKSTASIHSLHIRNFQSLHNIEIELFPFTVIVGPSSSGKSAFTRALRTLISNRRGTEWITTGQRISTITAKTDRGTVTLTRSRASTSTDNSYVITPHDDPTAQQKFMKLGGETPEEVSNFLGIPAGTSSLPPINFASQFDKPFLLDDSSGEVARTLGALTNVSVIFEGARESNRRKLTASSTLKLRSQDLTAIRARVPEFKALRSQDEALTRAEAHITAARDLQFRLNTLTSAMKLIETLEPAIERATLAAAVVVPDEKPIVRAQEALRSFAETLRRVPVAAEAVKLAQAAFDDVEAHEAELVGEYTSLNGEITKDVAGFFAAHVEDRFVRDGFVEQQHAVDVFVKFLETRAEV